MKKEADRERVTHKKANYKGPISGGDSYLVRLYNGWQTLEGASAVQVQADIMQTKGVAVLLVLLVAGGEASKVAVAARLLGLDEKTGLGHTANINDYIDNTLPMIENFIAVNGLDPMPLPDMVEGFSVRPLLITYRSELALTNGSMKNLSQLKSMGDNWVNYFAHMLRIHLAFSINNIECDYDYSATVMDLGPNGDMRATADSARIVVDLLFDFNNDEIHLQNFRLFVDGLRVRLRGNILFDWFVSPVVGLFVRLFNTTIITYVEVTMRVLLQDEIDKVNILIKDVMAGLM